MRILVVLILGFMFVACDQKGSLESTKERAQAEQEAGKDVDNRNLEEKAKKMEAELARRQDYYSALIGTFEGDVRVDKERYKIKIIITKSLPPYSGDRVRQLSEIESDLINLYLTFQIVQWHPDDTSTAVGCRITQLKPNMDRGIINAANLECPNSYSIYLSQRDAKSLDNKEVIAEKISESIKAQEISSVGGFVGSIQPSSNANNYSFIVKRKE